MWVCAHPGSRGVRPSGCFGGHGLRAWKPHLQGPVVTTRRRPNALGTCSLSTSATPGSAGGKIRKDTRRAAGRTAGTSTTLGRGQRGNAGSHLELIQERIKGAVSLHSALESGGRRTRHERCGGGPKKAIMKLTLLTTLAFLLLGDVCSDSASPASPPKNLEDLARQASEAEADLLLNPDLEEVIPPLALDSSFMLLNTSAQVNLLDSRSIFGDNVNLQWNYFKGSLPKDAVSIKNGYASRTDYVCKSGCEPGFYNPKWVPGSYGSYPSSAVRSCGGTNVFVGKNQYGLGKVVPKHSAFFLPWEGKEYFYKTYDVLSINRGSYSQKISNVIYNINQANLLEQPPQVLKISSVDNYECQTVKKTVTLEATTTNERRWDVQRSSMYGISISITAGIPSIISGSVSVSTEETFTTTLGQTSSTSNSHSLSVEVNVQPNYSCRVKMVGKKMTADIPYTARLGHTYWNGRTEWTTVVGTYKGLEVGEVKAVVERCEQIPNAQPCPSV
ncbi:NATT3 protein, partial [Polypterus senegalus]